MNYKHMFIAFLQRENILQRYMEELKNRLQTGHSTPSEYFHRLDQKGHTRDYVWSAFVFDGTKEGPQYWKSLADKWMNFFDKVDASKCSRAQWG